MTYTQEQIDSMSRFEVNKAVALKRGLYDKYDDIATDYVGTPNYYMAIAIEYGISPNFGHNDDGKTVFCTYPVPKLDTRSFGMSSLYQRSDTGLVVCAAFLMMEVD